MLTRRQFLQLAASALSAATALPLLNLRHVDAGNAAAPPASSDDVLYRAPLAPLGRVAMFNVDVMSEPRRDAEVVRRARRDDVLNLRGQVKGDALRAHNDIWFEVDDGFVYSSPVQPVLDVRNEPLPELAKQTFWGDITVPFADSRAAADPAARKSARLYFGSVYRVIDAITGADGAWWYRLQHGVTHSPGPWVPAEQVRRFDPVKDLSPLSPDVKDKRIEINIAKQLLTAFESDKAVLSTRVSTGFGRNFTPRGKYTVFRKAPGQRMIGGEGSDFYDLPGVPFPTYFTYRGIAIHGTYWHNDYGVVRSHGCVNVPSEVARWVWRWTTPVAPLDAADIRFKAGSGTPVQVV
jgi:lipoprotein-anchoring transpeptidase ErfK/SrfK